MKKLTFTPRPTIKANSHWTELVGRFTTRLNTIADTFLMSEHTHYPNGVKIQKFKDGKVASDLSAYVQMMGGKKENKEAILEEFWQLCDKADCGFTKKYWGCVPKRRK